MLFPPHNTNFLRGQGVKPRTWGSCPASERLIFSPITESVQHSLAPHEGAMDKDSHREQTNWKGMGEVAHIAFMEPAPPMTGCCGGHAHHRPSSGKHSKVMVLILLIFKLLIVLFCWKGYSAFRGRGADFGLIPYSLTRLIIITMEITQAGKTLNKHLLLSECNWQTRETGKGAWETPSQETPPSDLRKPLGGTSWLGNAGLYLFILQFPHIRYMKIILSSLVPVKIKIIHMLST